MSKSFVQVLIRVVLMGLLMLFGSCAAKKILVKNADNLLEHQIEKRLPLYSKQKEELSSDITAFLNETRPKAHELLPVIDGLDLEKSDKLESQYRQIATLYEDISLNFTRLLAKHMAVLDQKQQKEFFENLADENRQLAKKEPDDRLKKNKERFKKFFGAIDDGQKQMLTELQDKIEAGREAKLERRANLIKKLKEIYAEESSVKARQAEITSTFKDYQKNAHDHSKNLGILKTILATISPEQKEFFRKQVAEVKEILKLYLETEY
ncbi:MAG TPA: hypothetical protein VNJ08_14310 [Bacteriovoracaceae bacterium]|nr:hypothetical protein [Bacteriovoracaceae bacterium]